LRGGVHVCGCGHSGTSILTRLIGAHSQVLAIAGETGVAKKESYGRYRRALDDFRQQAEAAEARLWVEKTPKHVRHLGFILGAAPDSRIVLICRDPRDTVASLKRRYGRFGKALRRWCHDTGLVRRWQRHPQVQLVRYEDLVADPAGTLQQLMPFLELHFEPEQLNYHQQEVSWYGETAAAATPEAPPEATPEQYLQGVSHVDYRNRQINQPLFNNSGTHERYLSAAEIQRVRRRCGVLARTLGYSL
jgi:hypothetical protein